MSENKVTRIYPDRPNRNARWWILRIVSMVLALALVVGAVLLVLYWDDISLDTVRRFLTYLTVSSEEADGRFSFDQHSSNVFASADNGLSIASVGGLTVYDKNGEELDTVSCALTSPAIAAGDEVTLAYDIGGTTLIAVSNIRGVTAQLTTGGTLLDVDISADDAICYSACEDGKKSVLTVLDANQKEIYKWYSSSSYLMPCAVSGKASSAAAVSIGQSEHTYESTLLLFDTSSQESPSMIPIGNLLVYDLDFLTSGEICAVGETAAVLVDSSGNLTGTYDYEGRYLKDYALGGDGFVAFSLNQYQAGSRYSIVTVDAQTLAEKELFIGTEVLAVSAGGRYLAVLTVEGLQIYTKDLELYAEQPETGSATEVIMRDDGTALLISGSSASLFIP